MSRRQPIAGALTIAALTLAGCTSYDQADTEKTIVRDLSKRVEELTGTGIKSARCPADLEIEDGTKFECTAKLDNGEKIQVDGKVVDEDVRVDIRPEAILDIAGAG